VLLCVLCRAGAAAESGKPIRADVCIYGATPAGIVAAVTAKQEGMSVVLIEPSRWVGGILGAGVKVEVVARSVFAVGTFDFDAVRVEFK
jgi:flavin-dependent dehydrogenase